MKYKYWFSTGAVEIELGDEWGSLLKELDKKDAAINYWDQKGVVHYDGLEFEPSFMGGPERGISQMFDESPAFEYAKERIPDKYMKLLVQRGINGETFKKIAKEMGCTSVNARIQYLAYSKKFCKYYSDGEWIHSRANLDFPGIGKALSIPYKLTPDQVVEIRALRALCCSMNDIAERVGVSPNQVLMCLTENPVMKTICPSCGKIIQQAYRKKMRSFCSHYCYVEWYIKTCSKELSDRPSSKYRMVLNHAQELVLQYYKQLRVSYKEMREKTGIPLRVIIAYFNTNPLPYVLCKYCGDKIAGPWHRNTIPAFCSKKCMNAYYNRKFYAKKYKGKEIYKAPVIRTYECLMLAIEMRRSGESNKRIKAETGMKKAELDVLFRYEEKRQRKHKCTK